MNKTGLGLCCLLVACGTGLRADPPQEIPPGARIRVLAAGSASEGTLTAQDAESLTLQGKKLRDPLVVPRATLTKLYVSGGRARGKAAVIGAAIGLSVAGAIVLAGAACDESECFCSGSGCLTALALLGIPAAATGAGVGALVAPERWRELPVHIPPAGAAPGRAGWSRLRLGLAPIHRGAAVSLSCTF